ncbi:hypothetical protein H9660_05380 [Clostridium sp. Sa3CUN1]|uniref:Ribbon-helix-helix protein CopG domain-containing protein n=1 Tax=Clostridium gallinarum TaxID=2762246 RepID=A0ABR8Q2C5_9CLOT|nr:hypothetical protein [Clostridium gallinarum]MBD7914570.1 hypothetical protein [Clostridium gallinarum]
MDRVYAVVKNDFENKHVKEERIDISFSEEKYEELREIAIEVDCSIYEVIECIVDHNLLDDIDKENFKEIVINAYYSDVFI